MGSQSRSKGRRGEVAAIHLLTSRDFTVEDLSAGKACCDLLAIDPHSVMWSVEVKNRECIYVREFCQQAKRNAKPRTRWMVLAKVAGTSSWLVLRQGMRPTTWHEEGDR